MKLSQKVACQKTVIMICHMTNFTKVQGHKMSLKCGNRHVFAVFFTLNISGTMYIRIVNFGQRVVYCMTFKMRWHILTLVKGQGHRVRFKYSLFILFDISDISCEIWPNDDLDLWPWPLDENKYDSCESYGLCPSCFLREHQLFCFFFKMPSFNKEAL